MLKKSLIRSITAVALIFIIFLHSFYVLAEEIVSDNTVGDNNTDVSQVSQSDVDNTPYKDNSVSSDVSVESDTSINSDESDDLGLSSSDEVLDEGNVVQDNTINIDLNGNDVAGKSSVMDNTSVIDGAEASSEPFVEDADDGKFKLALRLNGSNKDYTWDAKKSEDNVIKLSVYYQNQVTKRSYEANSISISVPGIGQLNRASTLRAIDIAADKKESCEKKRDWSYEYNSTTDTYIFYNNKAIEAGESFNGSFELLWRFSSRLCINNYTQLLKAELSDGYGTVDSNEINFKFVSTPDKFEITKTAQAITSADGLSKFLRDGKTASDYAWVKYTFTYRIKEFNARGVKSRFLVDKFPKECVVASSSNVTQDEDGFWCYQITESSVLDSSTTSRTYSVIVGYPEDPYLKNVDEKAVKNTAYLYGIYNDAENDEREELATGSAEVKLERIKDQVVGIVPGKTMSPDYVYTDSLRDDISFTATLNATATAKGNQQYKIAITDDYLEICTGEDRNYTQLKKDEYKFTSITVPGKDSFKNENGYTLSDGEYRVKLSVLYADELEDNNYENWKLSKYQQIYEGQWDSKSITVDITKPAVAIRAEISGLTESVKDFYITTRGIINIKNYIDENPNHIFNYDFTDLLDSEGDSLINNIDYSQERLKERDKEIYNRGVLRAYDSIIIQERPATPVTPGSYYATANIDPFSVDENIENFITKLSHGISVNNREEKELISIEIHGVNNQEELKNLIDTLKFNGKGLSFKNPLSEDDIDISEYLKERATISQEDNEISVIFDFKDNPIISKSFTIWYEVDGILNYEQYYNTANPTYTTSTYAYVQEGNLTVQSRTNHKDKSMSTETDSESILLALASHQQMLKSVKTQYSGEFVQEGAVAPMDTEYTYRLKLRNGYNTLEETEFIDILEHAELTDVEGEEKNKESEWYGTFVNVDTSYLKSIGLTAEVYYADTTDIDDDTEWVRMEEGEEGKWVPQTEEEVKDVKTVKVKIKDEIAENSIVYVDINMKAPKNDESLVDKKAYNTYSINCQAVDLYTGIKSSYMDNMPSNTTDVRLVEKEYNVVITKTDADTGMKLTGVEFEIYDEQHHLVSSNKTGILGNTLITSLKEGTYTIEEIKAPMGYKKIEGYKLIIKDGKYHVEYLDYGDEDIEGEVTFSKPEDGKWEQKEDGTWQSKIEKKSNQTATLTSEEFTINKSGTVSFEWAVSSESASYDYVYYTITKKVETRDNTVVGTGESTRIGGKYEVTEYDNLEYSTITKDLKEGTYVISFTYRKDSSGDKGLDSGFVKNIKYTSKTQVTKKEEEIEIESENGIPTINLNVENRKARGSITVYKIDEYLTSSKAEKPLSGVKFNLLNTKGDILKSGTTDTKGNILFDDLTWGQTYILQEDGEVKGYEVAVENTYLSGSNIDKVVTVKNKRKTGTVTLTKQDEVEETILLSGAVYGLYANGNIYDESGNVIYKKDALIKTAQTDEEGIVKFERIIWGDYYLKEINTVYGYDLSNEKYTFTISATNVDTVIKKIEKEKRSRGSMQIVKTDDEGGRIEGVEFKLYKKGGEEVRVKDEETGNYIPYLTDDLGILKIENLEWGDYYIQEYRPASGYEKLETTFSFTIDRSTFENGNTIYKVKNDETNEEIGEIINHKKKGEVKLTKYECNASGEETDTILPGAVYELYTASGELKGKYTTDAKGEIIVQNLEWGGYYFQEKEAPAGFSISNKKISFVINSKTADFMQELKAYDKKESGEIKINKKIRASNIYTAHGNSTFIFKIVGRDESGEIKVTFYKAVTFTEADIENADADGYITKEIVITEVEPYKYEISEEGTYRYDVEQVIPGQNAEVGKEGKTGIINLLQNNETEENNASGEEAIINQIENEVTEGDNEVGGKEVENLEEQAKVKKGEITFKNEKTSEGLLTHTSLVTNSTQSKYYVVGIAAKTKEEKYEVRTELTKDNFEYTLLYSGGQEQTIDIGELENITIEEGSTYTQKVAGTYIVNMEIEYEGKLYKVETQVEFIRTIRILADEVEIGDYVAYDANAGLKEEKKYIADKAITGGSQSKTFSSKTAVKWRVLDVDRESGRIQLIPEKPIGSTTFRGIDAFIYSEDILNNIANVYGEGIGAESARSITIEDIEGEDYRGNKRLSINHGTSTQKVFYSGNFIDVKDDGMEVMGGTPSEENEKILVASREKPVTVTQTSYRYNAINYCEDETIFGLLFNDKNYWLASRAIGGGLYSDRCGFQLRNVNKYHAIWGALPDEVGYHILYDNTGYMVPEYQSSYGVMPIVYLEPNILTSGMDASGAWVLKTE